MAADTTAPGQVTVVAADPAAVAAFLNPKPVATLYGIGPATTETAPKSNSVSYEFSHDELDPTAHRRALLDLCERLGLRLRTTGQVGSA
ncbi:hypothetical protein [Streptomyces sp. NBC_00342]|uniref:hypothetical protein n=1 Tax=Streptomyces sp. NBC_00342 TaxID=2975718 RepID=UPI003FA7A0E7